jgi:hypothetical protein
MAWRHNAASSSQGSGLDCKGFYLNDNEEVFYISEFFLNTDPGIVFAIL